MAPDATPSPTPAPSAPAPRSWNVPRLTELPKLTALTLASAIGGGGGTGGGGSTVFGLLLAVGLLVGCSPDRGVTPTEGEMPRPIAAVTCNGDLSTQTVTCGGGPSAVAGRELLGGQGSRVAVRSTNVHYNSGTGAFTFDVTVQNLGAQTIGLIPNGVDVFFLNEPVVTVGSGAITIDNATQAFFTAVDQWYYHFAQTLAPLDTSATQGWQFTIPGTVGQFTFTVLVAADVADQGGILRWNDVLALSETPFKAVASYTQSDAMAVGRLGVSWRWNGTGWSPLARQTPEDLVAVEPLGSGEYVAVGNLGGIYRSKGNIWSKVYTPGNYLSALWVQDSTHFVAVGSDRIVTYSAGTFQENVVTLPGGPLGFVGGSSDGTVRVALSVDGERYTSFFSNPWADSGSVFPDASPRVINGLFVDGNDDMIWSFRGVNAAVMRGASDTLYRVGAGRFPTAMLSLGDDSLLVAMSDNNLATALVKVRYGLATTSTITGTDSLQCSCWVTDLARADGVGDKFFAVTDAAVGQLVRWAGSWQDQAPTTLGGSRNLWMHLDTLYMVNGSSIMQQIANGNVVEVPITGASGLQKIWGSETGGTPVMYGINGSAIFQRTGYDTWSHQYSDPDTDDLYAIWGDAATDNWIAVGQYATLLQRVHGGGWIAQPIAPSFDFTAVWGCGNTAWITTSNGQLMRWDDGVISYDAAFSSVFPSPLALYAVSGTSCTDVWVAGKGDEFYHWNGSSWTHLSSWSADKIVALSAQANGEVYFGNDQGGVGSLVLGTGATEFRSATAVPVQSIAGILKGELFVAYSSLLVHGTR